MGIVFQVSNILLKTKCTILRYWWLSAVTTSISIYTTLDRKHDRSRLGAASLATTIAEPKARPYFLTGICKGLFLLPLQQEPPEL